MEPTQEEVCQLENTLQNVGANMGNNVEVTIEREGQKKPSLHPRSSSCISLPNTKCNRQSKQSTDPRSASCISLAIEEPSNEIRYLLLLLVLFSMKISLCNICIYKCLNIYSANQMFSTLISSVSFGAATLQENTAERIAGSDDDGQGQSDRRNGSTSCIVSNPNDNDDGIEIDEDATRNDDTPESIYDLLTLGLIQTIVYSLSGDKKTSIFSAIAFGIAIASADTISDCFLFSSLLKRKFFTTAYIMLSVDLFPGAIVFLHHATSSVWTENTWVQRILSVLLLPIQPFSLIVTNFTWMLSLGSDHRHYLARLSSIIHGITEGPIQFMIITYLWSKGMIQLPWEESTWIVDENKNVLPLGKVGAISLTFTTIGIIKGAMEIFEAPEDKFQIVVFTSLSITFRLLSFCLLVQFYKSLSAIFFVTLGVINILMFLLRSELKHSWIGVVSSCACSFIVPVNTTERPHLFQKSTAKTQENVLNQKQRFNTMKKNSSWLSFVTTPFIFVADLTVPIVINFTDYKNNSIWTEAQLCHWIYFFFIPTFVLSMVATYAIYPNEGILGKNEKEPESLTNEGQNSVGCIDKIKAIPNIITSHIKCNYLSDIAAFGMILVVIIHSVTIPKMNSYILGFKNNDSELNMVEGTTTLDLTRRCKYENNYYVCNSMNFTFNNTVDYRNISVTLEENVVYVNQNINITQELPTGKYYLLRSIIDWKNFLPDALMNLPCKRCIEKEPTHSLERCNSFAYGIGHIAYCNGTY